MYEIIEVEKDIEVSEFTIAFGGTISLSIKVNKN